MHTQLKAYKVPFDVIDVAQDSDALIHTSNFSLPHSPYLKEKWQLSKIRWGSTWKLKEKCNTEQVNKLLILNFISLIYMYVDLCNL